MIITITIVHPESEDLDFHRSVRMLEKCLKCFQVESISPKRRSCDMPESVRQSRASSKNLFSLWKARSSKDTEIEKSSRKLFFLQKVM